MHIGMHIRKVKSHLLSADKVQRKEFWKIFNSAPQTNQIECFIYRNESHGIRFKIVFDHDIVTHERTHALGSDAKQTQCKIHVEN